MHHSPSGMRMDAHCTREVHDRLNDMYGRTDFGPRFEHLAWKFGIKGKTKKDWLTPVEPVTRLAHSFVKERLQAFRSTTLLPT